MAKYAAIVALLAFLVAPVAAQATFEVGNPDPSQTRDVDVDATNYNGSSLSVWVNGFKQTWDWNADPDKRFSVANGGTVRIKTDKSDLTITNHGSWYETLFASGGTSTDSTEDDDLVEV